jgi:hypothetical protein
MDLRNTEWHGMDWINLAQDMDQWRAVVNTVMKFWVLKILVNSSVASAAWS